MRGLIDDGQGGFRVGVWCVALIFTLKQIYERAQEKKTACMWVLWIWRRCMEGLIGKHYCRCLECMMWVDGFTFCPDPFFLHSFLDIVACRQCVRVKWGESEQFKIVG